MKRPCGNCRASIGPENTSGLCRACKRQKFEARNRAWVLEIEMGTTMSEIAAREGLTRETVSGATREFRASFPKHTVSRIIDAAVRATFFKRQDIIGGSRHRSLVWVRHAVCFLAIESGNSYSATGRVLDRDHSTIIHAQQKAIELTARDSKFADLVNAIRDAITTPAYDPAPVVLTKAPIIAVVKADPAPAEIDEDLDDMEILSRAVARHYEKMAA